MKRASLFLASNLGLVLTFLAAIFLVNMLSCENAPPKDSRLAQAAVGKTHFQKYCTSCHGDDGKGVYIDSLKTQPADLTKIGSAKSEGFPILYVANVIDGRKMAKSHGNREMPVWGEVFSGEEYLNEDQIKGKLAEIIAYLMTIQK
jgi:mono/diheme cytochrome c family protein